MGNSPKNEFTEEEKLTLGEGSQAIAKAEKIVNLPSTDQANAELFCLLYGEKFRYLDEEKAWVCFDGLRWQTAWKGDGGAWGKASNQARSCLIRALKLKLELFDRFEQGKIRFQPERYKILQDQNFPKVKAALEMAASSDGMSFSVTQFDRDPFLLGCQNTIIDLKTGMPVSQAQLNNNLVLKSNNLIYDPQTKAPIWEETLKGIFEDDKETISFIKRLFGYTVTGLVREEKLFILLGKGGTGKSTILKILGLLLGDYYAATPANIFYDSKWDRTPWYLYNLCGKRVSVTAEMKPEKKIDDPFVKKITGGDILDGECKFKMPIKYNATAKVFWLLNEMVRLNIFDEAIIQRLCVIPFKVCFREDRKRVNLDLKEIILPGEISGILNWALEGALEYQEKGLEMPTCVEKATQEVIELCNPVASFIKAKLIHKPDVRVTFQNIWGAFGMFKMQAGIQTSITENSFSREMARLGHGSIEIGGKTYFEGVELKP